MAHRVMFLLVALSLAGCSEYRQAYGDYSQAQTELRNAHAIVDDPAPSTAESAQLKRQLHELDAEYARLAAEMRAKGYQQRYACWWKRVGPHRVRVVTIRGVSEFDADW